MEVKYDKTAVLEYIANFRNLQDLMRRDMDESLNKYNVCKQEYSRIFTECEEESRRAYNRVLSAEREIQMADMMMEQAMASTSDSDDEDTQPDYDMINRAQEMRRQAEVDLVVAQADYSRAQENIGKLNAVMEKYETILEAESKVVNDSFTECSIVGSKAGEALEQYVGVMDKAYSALYESSSPQGTTSGHGSSSAGSSSNSATSGGPSRGAAGTKSLSEPGDVNSGGNSYSMSGGDGMTSRGENKGATNIQSSNQTDVLNNGSVTSKGATENSMVAVSGLGEAQTTSGNDSSGTSFFSTGVTAASVLSYMIAGKKRKFSNTKAGLNQAYKAAIKANDKSAAGEILQAFYAFGNANGDIPPETVNEEKSPQNIMWSDMEYGDVSDKIQIADRNSSILEWSGEKGNSLRVPKDKSGELSQRLRDFGVEGIPYVDGNIDFSQVTKYEVEFADAEKLYLDLGRTIKFSDLMTEDAMKSRTEFNQIIRTKWQSIAKQQIVDKIITDEEFAKNFSAKTGVNTDVIKTVSDLKSELRLNGLTLHETTDCKKIQFVPTQIHDAFKHVGGTAEMLERLINGDIHNKVGI